MVVAAVVGGVVGSRAARNNDGGSSSYPNYSNLTYSLIDSCEWKPKFELCVLGGYSGEKAD